MTHLPYILAAYCAAAAIIAVMITWVICDLRIQRRRLARLETDGSRLARRIA
jgi:heme exporter protein CcmD